MLVHMLFEGQTGITCPRECLSIFPYTTFTLLRMPAWRGGVVTVLYPTQAMHFTVTPARDEQQLHIKVLELGLIRLTLLHLEEEVIGTNILIESDNTASVSYIN